MSNTRHAPEGAPFRPERFASSDAYNIGLGALLVAKRCELLDCGTAELMWLLQYRSLPPRDGAAGRIGGVERIAAELLPLIPTKRVLEEDLDDGSISECETKPKAYDLAAELSKSALDPRTAPARQDWIKPLTLLRENLVTQARARLAATSISAIVWDALEFTRGTSEASLVIGDPRLGKSETAKVFCESQCGLARYVEVPSTNDERSLYKAVAEALGVADGLAYKGSQIRERVEEVLSRSKLMLVLDEAQNLWPRNMRPRAAPDRVLWINSLINKGVPVALVGLPEFTTWMRICAEKTGWSPSQIEQRITIHRRLPDALTQADFETLARHFAPFLPEPAIKYLVGCALGQDGAAFVKKVLSAASYRAAKVGRTQPTFTDIQTAIRDDIMPSATSLRQALATQPAKPRQSRSSRQTATAPAPTPSAASVPARYHLASIPQPVRDGAAALTQSVGGL